MTGTTSNNRILPTAVSVLLVLFPLTMLNLHHAANFIFLCIFLLSCSGFIPGFKVWPESTYLNKKNVLWLIFCFAIYPSSILLHYLVVGYWSTPGFDAPARFLMAVPIIMILFGFEIKGLNFAYLTAIFGAWIALAEACYQIVVKNQQYAMTYFTWPSNFGDLILVLGILSMGFYGGKYWRKVLALSGLFATLIASYLSQSRGSWMAIIVASGICILLRRQTSFVRIAKSFALLIILSIALYVSVPKLNARINLGWYELNAPLSEVADTSVGLRRQFWEASFMMIKEHPIMGIGRLQFAKEKSKLIDQGLLTPKSDGWAHPHNELLYAQVELGIIGLIGLLALYFGPFFYFYRALFDSDLDIHNAAKLGILIVVCYLVFGLVDVMLVAWVMEAPVYIISVLIPMLIINSKRISQLNIVRK
jgi:O-antigen ligase